MAANNQQIGGEHYKLKAIQPWDYISANGLGYLEGCVVKYVSRFREKGGLEDLQKARHYLAKLIELETAKKPKTEKPVVVRPAGKRGPGRPKKIKPEPKTDIVAFEQRGE